MSENCLLTFQSSTVFAMAWRLKSSNLLQINKYLIKHRHSNDITRKVYIRCTSTPFSSLITDFKIPETKLKLPRWKHPSSASFHRTKICRAKIEKFTLSDIGEGIREVTVKEWFVKVNDTVNQFDNICEVQSDKASVTITSRYNGIIRKLYCDIDEIIAVGNPLCDIEVTDDIPEIARDEKVAEPSREVDSNISINQVLSDGKKVLSTPAVRRLAIENNIKLSDIRGSGKDGRILKEDVLAFISGDDTSWWKTAIGKEATVQVPSLKPHVVEAFSEDRKVPIAGFVKVMVKTMKASLAIPHFVYSDEIDVTNLISIRSKIKSFAESEGVKLTFLPFFVKAASMALSHFPIVNASVDEKCENIIYKAKHNIGIAIDTPVGLAVPNVKNVQSLTLLEVARELNRLQTNALKGSLQPSDVTGGTFTLSNIGAIGGTYTKPVILPPEVAIGALGKIQVLPRFDDNGQLVKASIIAVSWAADHRVLDGATIARFSNKWKQYIESPSTMLLYMK